MTPIGSPAHKKGQRTGDGLCAACVIRKATIQRGSVAYCQRCATAQAEGIKKPNHRRSKRKRK